MTEQRIRPDPAEDGSRLGCAATQYLVSNLQVANGANPDAAEAANQTET
jgi:hypothetical protein